MIINATQHIATPEQVEAGVIDLTGFYITEIKNMLNFEAIPETDNMRDRALRIVEVISSWNFVRASEGKEMVNQVMIGGAPFFMSILEQTLKQHDYVPLYAFSKRVSEERLVDGKATKTSVFKHLGFYKA